MKQVVSKVTKFNKSLILLSWLWMPLSLSIFSVTFCPNCNPLLFYEHKGSEYISCLLDQTQHQGNMGHTTGGKQETKDLPKFFRAKTIIIFTKTLLNEKLLYTFWCDPHLATSLWYNVMCQIAILFHSISNKLKGQI